MRKVPTPKPTIILPKVTQITDSHCGPAVLQVLFSHLKKTFTQDEIVSVARIKSRIKKDGMRPNYMADAVMKLAPDCQFWFKQHATSRDLSLLVNTYKWPVGVNWQNLFYATPEEELDDTDGNVGKYDFGHYSVVVGINEEKDQLIVADPFHEYSSKPRLFSLKWFKKRWHDDSHIIDRKTKKKDSIWTKRFIFVVAPKDATFPKKLRMKLPDQLDELRIQKNSR